MPTWAAKVRTRVGVGLCAVMLAVAGAHAEQVAISFRDLPDPAAQDFDDPFRDMGFEMLEELRTVVRLEQRLKGGEVTDAARHRLEAQLESARGALIAAGHDIEGLLARRWVVAEARRRALFATNPDLHQTAAMIDGFLIPAGTDEDGLSVGYLVPKVGMCSHMPPPPPNQLIRVTFDAAFPAPNLYTPVTVAGMLAVDETDATVFVLDGEVRMSSMWNLDATEVTLAADPDRASSLSAWQMRKFPHGNRALGRQPPSRN